jgi:phospholipid/cholesterol/gamma-HCH transport system substrate-binding protein
MARRLAWSNVGGGLIAIAVIVGVSVATLKYARVGALRGDTIRLYAVVKQARGLLKGSEVWLSGQKIGKVTEISFRSPSIADTSTRLLLELEVLDEYQGLMHRDAEAQVRSGGSLIGAVVVYVTPGTMATPLIRANDTIVARPQLDIEGSAGGFQVATRELPAIMNNVKELRHELERTRGTLGAVINEGLAQRGQLAATGAQISRLRARVSGSRGTVGLAMQGGLGDRARRVMSRVDSVRALLGSTQGSVGRFRNDSALVREVADIRNELTIVRALLDEPRGTAGRIMRDSAVFSALGDAQREMGLLMADVKKHPLRYNPF